MNHKHYSLLGLSVVTLLVLASCGGNSPSTSQGASTQPSSTSSGTSIDNPSTSTGPTSDPSTSTGPTSEPSTPTPPTSYEIGSYPQSKVTDEALISTLTTIAGTLPTSENRQNWTDYGYYISNAVSSYMWYIDLANNGNKYRGVYFTSYRPKDTSLASNSDNSFQDDNGYNLSTVYFFKYEPISWKILTSSGNKLFLMANISLDAQDFFYSDSFRYNGDTTIYPNNYKESHIRSWLNDRFINTAFNEDEQSKILTTEVDNSVSTTYTDSEGKNPNICENTNDRIFLLSHKDATNTDYGFNSDSSKADSMRKIGMTDYAKSQGIYEKTANHTSTYFTRSPNYYNWSYTECFWDEGKRYLDGHVYYTYYSPLPVMWISQ